MTVMNESSNELLYEVEDAVGLVTFNRPQAMNALTFDMYEQLADICEKADSASVKALVICGAGGKAFAAGTDISLFRGFDGADDGRIYEAKMEAILGQIEACAVPTIAAVTGVCTGGGAAIAAVCDVRLATKDLRFGFPIARTLGNCLSISNLVRLSALLGPARAREMMVTSRLMGADEALSGGVISVILDDHAALMEHAKNLAAKITGFAPLTLKATKEMFQRINTVGPTADDDDLIALCYGSDDFREGLDAFLTKRRPDWKGE